MNAIEYISHKTHQRYVKETALAAFIFGTLVGVVAGMSLVLAMLPVGGAG